MSEYYAPTSFRIADPDPDAGTVRLINPRGGYGTVALAELDRCGRQDHEEGARYYTELSGLVRAALEREREVRARTEEEADDERRRLASIKKCGRHRANESYERCFRGPVSRNQNPSAHGGVCIVETCRCGATRETNVNGQHAERGAWS